MTATPATAAPFDWAETYEARGWPGTLALPPRSKKEPERGFTGALGRWPTHADFARWREQGRENICQRVPKYVIGIDVDHYDQKVGGLSIKTLEGMWGELPATWWSTSRTDGVSGIRFYRVPPEHAGSWPAVPAHSIEVVQHSHRYALVWPSIHPLTGGQYRFIRPDGTDAGEGEIPSPADFPMLPVAWIEGLLSFSSKKSGTSTPRGEYREVRQEAREWLGKLPRGERCRYVAEVHGDVLSAAQRGLGSAHDGTRDKLLVLLRAGDSGHVGVFETLEELREVFVETVSDRSSRGDAEFEFNSMVEGGIHIVLAEPDAIRSGRGCDCDDDPFEGIFADAPQAEPRFDHENSPQPEARLSSWAPHDPGRYLDADADPDPPPSIGLRTDGKALFYKGTVNAVAGESGSGKSWFLQGVCAQVLEAGGRVTYIDFESNGRQVHQRLLSLGVDAAVLRERFRYIRPLDPLTKQSRRELLASFTDNPQDLAVVDGITDAMTLHGLDPISNKDYSEFNHLLLRPIAEIDPCVVTVDHVTKSADSRNSYAIGAQHKRAAVSGAAYTVDARQPFGRGRSGLLSVTVNKDRGGYVDALITSAKRVAEVRLASNPEGTVVTVTIVPPEDARDADGHFRPTGLMEGVSKLIEIYPGATMTQIYQGIAAKKATVEAAVNALIAEGYVRRGQGTRNSYVHTSVRPFRREEDGLAA